MAAQDLSVFVRHRDGGIASMELAVDGIRCAGCMHAIESGLGREPAILGARVNLALKRVSVEWREALLRQLGEDRVEPGQFLIDGLCVAADSRGQGIGTALVLALCEAGQAMGYGAARIDVVDSNPGAQALYARLGFAVTRSHAIGPLRHVFGFRRALTMLRPL